MPIGSPAPSTCSSPPPAVSGFVLAGGRSARLGQDKALLPWEMHDGRVVTLLDHAVARLRRVCNIVKVCASRDDLPHYEPLVRDAAGGAGPLGGIVAALEQSQSEWNLFLAVDLPFVPVELLQALAGSVQLPQTAQRRQAKPASSAGFLCLMPYVADRPQPLCAVYHRSLAKGLRHALESGSYKIMQALGQAIAQQIPGLDASDAIAIRGAEDFARTGQVAGPLSTEEWFLNVNTAEDWVSAAKLKAAAI